MEEQVVPRALKLPGQPDENCSEFQFTWEPAEHRVDSRGNELSWVEGINLWLRRSKKEEATVLFTFLPWRNNGSLFFGKHFTLEGAWRTYGP